MVERLIEDIADGPRRVGVPAGRLHGDGRDRRLPRLRRAGRVHDHPRRRAGRRGHALDPAPDRDRLGLAAWSATRSASMLGRRLGREFALKHGPQRAAHRGALQEGRGLLRQTRRQDDLHRALARLRAPADAVHGRRVGHELPALPALRRARRRAVGATWCLLGYIFWQSFEQVASIAGRGAIAFAILLGLVRRRLPGGQAPAPPRAAPARSRRGSSARPSGRCCGRWRLVRARAVDRCPAALALRAAPAVAADRAAAAVPRSRGSHPASSASSSPRCSRSRACRSTWSCCRSTCSRPTPLLPGRRDRARHRARHRDRAADHARQGAGVIGSLWFVVLVHVLRHCAFLLARRRVGRGGRAGGRVRRSPRSRSRSSSARSTGRARPTRSSTSTGSRTRPATRRMAVTYLAIAVVLSRAVPAARRVALVIGGAVLAVAIGLSRVYLRVHYLSDVSGGWAVGPGRLLALRSRRARRRLSASTIGAARPRPTPGRAPALLGVTWTASPSPTSSSPPPAWSASAASRC